MTNTEIRKIEEKYGLAYFRMGLTHLFDVGYRNITAENVAESKKAIMAEAEADSGSGISIMTPAFQCHLLDIALELAQFGLWDLLAYVKTDVVFG